MDRELAEDRASELGYRTAGARELALRDWMALRGEPDEAAPTPRAFDRLVNRLRVKRWTKANPDRKKQHARRYYNSSPEIGRRQTELARKRRHERYHADPLIIVCMECGAEFCPVSPPRGGPPRKYCSRACMQRERYQRITPGARRCARRNGQP